MRNMILNNVNQPKKNMRFCKECAMPLDAPAYQFANGQPDICYKCFRRKLSEVCEERQVIEAEKKRVKQFALELGLH